jgi:MFS family permease
LTAPSGGYGNIPYSDNEDEERQHGSAVEVLEITSSDIPYGVRKMEMLSRYMTTKPYIPIYIITLFTSLSSTTTPAVEPFLLSTFGGHAYISSIAIVTSIAYAVCKPPMAKILDTFGRAEGLAISAVLYGLGFFLVSSSSGIVSFAAARVLGSAGAQGINLAQQVIVADITSLASRALVTSTIFLPWLLTPWLGPPLGQVFKDAGEAGYRSAYTLFGIAVPLSCLFLLFFLWNGYRKVLKIAKDSKPMMEALKQATGNGESVQADDALTWEPRGITDLATEAREELDLLGIIYLMTGATLFLLPLSLAATSAKAWSDRE